MNCYVYVDNRKKDILILGEDPTQGLDDTTLTSEKKYSISFTEYIKRLCLILHDNRGSSYLFVNGVEIHKFEAKDSEINAISLCLGNISKDFSVDNIKNNWLYWYVFDVSVDYDAIAVDYITFSSI